MAKDTMTIGDVAAILKEQSVALQVLSDRVAETPPGESIVWTSYELQVMLIIRSELLRCMDFFPHDNKIQIPYTGDPHDITH